MDDRELLAQLKQGEEQALSQVVRQYGAYAAAVVRAAGPGLSVQDQEEAAAEAFVKLWRAAGQIDLQRGSLKSYLAAVCRNEARSRLRALRPVQPLEEDFLSPPDQQAAARLERREMQAITRQALDGLDEPTRQVFVRHYYRRHTTAQIAQDLSISQSAVKSRLARGREKLRKALQERGVTYEDVV